MLEAGYQIGSYIVESELGGGGFATVYQVRDAAGVVRALKVLDPRLRADEQHRARFLDEARIQLERLDHPNIVKVYEILATPKVAALVMEYVPGADLGEYIEARGGPVPYEEFVAIALPVVDAVGHAHDRGVIHRDLKPANVLLARVDGRLVPKVTDFGVAKVLTASAKKKSTATGATIGTTGYMSPEQVKGSKNVTARSDVFSLGAMLYELASGSEAFDADSDYEVMDAIVKGRFRRASVAAPGLPGPVADAIDRALSPLPGDRFASCGELAAALQVRDEVGAELAPMPAGDPGAADAALLRCVACRADTRHQPSEGRMRCTRCGVRRGMPVEHGVSPARSREDWVIPKVREPDSLQKWIPHVGIAAIVLGLASIAKCAF